MPESSPDGWVLSDAALQKVIKAVRQTLGRPLNQRDDRGAAKPFTAVQWFPFVNTSGETIPGRGVVKIVADVQVHEAGDEIVQVVYKGDKPDTTFVRKYGICWPFPVEDEEVGFLTFDGPQWANYDSGTPALGEGWGPKPGQWTLSKGFPGFTVDGIVKADDKLLLGTLHEITSLLCKATAQNAAGTMATDTSDYTIMQGTPGSETSAGFTTQPAIYSRGDTMINEFFYATFRNGIWYAELEDNAWLGKADSAISAGSSGTISLWTGTPGSESDSGSNATSIYNRTSVDIPSGGWVRIGRVNGKFYCEPWSC